MEATPSITKSGADLKTFLRARRQRLNPEELGLPSRRLRCAGVRREDVAELLEVSPLWYALFESGTSGRRFSRTFIERLQDILRLDETDRSRFLELVVTSGHASPEVEANWHRSRRQSLINEVASTLQLISAATTIEVALNVAESSLRIILFKLGVTTATE
jgi:transcriptional regulator with XRE-family HTH domain